MEVSKLVYNLCTGLSTYLHRVNNPFTKCHGHTSTCLSLFLFFSKKIHRTSECMIFFPGGYDACDGTIGGLAEGRGMKPLERICLVFGVFFGRICTLLLL